MSRSIWKGEISFGLLNIQVDLHSAIESNKISFHLMDKRDGSRISYKRMNEETGEEVPWSDIGKSYEYEDGNYILIDKEKLKEFKPELTKTIELEEFVPLDEIPRLYFDKPYFLIPNKRSQKAYMLLWKVLSDEGKGGLGRVVIRSKEHLALLTPYENSLSLNLMFYPEEIRSLDEYNLPDQKTVLKKIKKKEIELSKQLVESLSGTWEPENYKDTYKEELEDWIEESIKNPKKRKKKNKSSKKESNVINIEELLKKSIKKKRA